MKQGVQMQNLILAILGMLALSSCISTSITRVEGISKGDKICIIKNHTVKKSFAEAFKVSLEKQGYVATLINKGTLNCMNTATYTAIYGRHYGGSYLARANLEIYINDRLVGQAKYHAPHANLLKFGSARTKIDELVQKLFPNNEKNNPITDDNY